MGYGWDSDDKPREESGGHDYGSARAAYKSPASETPRASRARSASEGSRSAERVRDYTSRVGKTPPPVGLTVKTDSPTPWVIACDVTGSMQTWPGLIFEKLALFGKEIERYMANYAVSFCAFGDARCDSYPLQVRNFNNGEALDTELAGLYPEGSGGDSPESHGLVAYYYLNHCEIDKAVKPIFVMITDTDFHPSVTVNEIKNNTGDIVQSETNAKRLFERLKEKFNFYVVLRNGSSREFWEGLLDAQHVVDVNDPRDIVEILIGIGAAEAGAMGDFEHRSSARHSDKPERVSRVTKSLSAVKAASEAAKSDGAVASEAKPDDKSHLSKKLV